MTPPARPARRPRQMTSPPLSAAALQRLRRDAIRRFRVRTERQALQFIHAVGFCYAFTPGPGQLPGLFDVLATRSEDRRWAWVWDWKEALPAAKKVFYGRVLRRKPTFISLEYVPHFFALSGNVGDPDDYRRLYDAGRLSYSARRVYELVARKGPLTTRQIRQAIEPDRRGSSGRLLRALADLQGLYLLARIGEVGNNPGNYADVWDTFDRWLPDAVARASRISHRQAAAGVLETAIQDLRQEGRLSRIRGPAGEERLVLRGMR